MSWYSAKLTLTGHLNYFIRTSSWISVQWNSCVWVTSRMKFAPHVISSNVQPQIFKSPSRRAQETQNVIPSGDTSLPGPRKRSKKVTQHDTPQLPPRTSPIDTRSEQRPHTVSGSIQLAIRLRIRVIEFRECLWVESPPVDLCTNKQILHRFHRDFP